MQIEAMAMEKERMELRTILKEYPTGQYSRVAENMNFGFRQIYVHMLTMSP